MYVGTAYHGWQVQKNAVTVAETLEHSLASVVGHPVKCTGAGRTDAGPTVPAGGLYMTKLWYQEDVL